MLKKFILFLFVLFIPVTACQKHRENGETKKSIAYEYYKSGTVRVETETLDGKAHGIMKIYTPQGNLEKVYTYSEGKKEGPAVEYYPNGKLRTRAVYSNNRMNGKAVMYYKTGELYRETIYKEGKIDGTRKTYYKDGSLMASANYRLGYPGPGLKEFNSSGKEVQPQPRIIVEPSNQLAFSNTYILNLSLSDNQKSTVFYIGELIDGYLHEGCWPIEPKDGVARYMIHLNKGEFIMETLVISARFQTPKGNIGMVSREYNLAIDNK